MSKNFTVDVIALAEYATQDYQGRGVLCGIIPGVLTFNAPPRQLPMMQLYVNLRPLSRDFTFKIFFRDPDNKDIVAFEGSYRNAQEPDEREALFLINQTPPAKFTKSGVYTYGVSENGRVVVKQKLVVEIGVQSPIALGSLDMHVSTMADLT